MRVHWEAYGDGEPPILLLPTWSIAHSRHWKAQIPYLSRHFRVVTFDGRGNGFSDRPPETQRPTTAREFVADAIAVMDATGLETAVAAAGLSMGGLRALLLAAAHPDRVNGAFSDRRRGADAEPLPTRPRPYRFDEELDSYEGWAKLQPTLLAAGLPRLPGVLLRRDASPSRTPPSRSRTAWHGGWTRPRRR